MVRAQGKEEKSKKEPLKATLILDTGMFFIWRRIRDSNS